MKNFFLVSTAISTIVFSLAAHAYEIPILEWRGRMAPIVGMTCTTGNPPKDNEPCVEKREFEVPTPDGKGVGKVRWVTELLEDGAKYGMADKSGETLIEPVEGNGIILTTRSMVMCGNTGCFLYSADEKKKKLGTVTTLPLPQSPPILMVMSKDDKGRQGLAPLHRDGSLGPILVGASTEDAFANNNLGVFKVHDAPGVTASVIVDLLGQIVWAGPELRVYGVPNSTLRAGKSTEGEIERRTTLELIGHAPFHALDSDPNMYIPLDGMKPMALPANVIGVIPAGSSAPPIGSNYVGDRPDDIEYWIIVKKVGGKNHYFISERKMDQTIDGVLADLPKFEEIDDIRYFYKKIKYEDPVTSGNPTVHRVKTKDWRTMYAGLPALGKTAQSSYDRWMELSLAENKAKIAQEQALADWKDKTEKRAQADRKAKEKADHESQVKYWQTFAEEFKSTCTDDNRINHCAEIEDAAFGLGDPSLSEYLSHQPMFHAQFNSRLQQACAVSQKACHEAQRIDDALRVKEEQQAELRYQLENGYKTYTQQKIKDIQKGSDYTVPYYDGGQLKYKTMTSDEYHRMFGN
jgi:hypothetical protein